MNKSLSLTKFLFNVIKPYKGYVISMMFIALYWAINNSLSPYVLKLIIDKVAALSGEKSDVFNAVKPYVIFYIVLWIGISNYQAGNVNELPLPEQC